MVDEHNSRMKNKKKKRKDRSSDDEEGPLQSTSSKSSRKWFPEWKDNEPETDKPKVHIEEPSPWRNLQLILSIQNKNLDLQTKLELAFNYVNLRTTAEANEITEVSETVSLARVVVFVGNWIQTVLITSVKKDKSGEPNDSSTCLDNRCWIILKFCLEESLQFNISLCILRDFLRVIEYIASGVLSHLINESDSSVNSVLSCNNQDIPNMVLDCVSLVFSSHGGVSNENLDLWITTICMVLKLLQKVVANKIDESRADNFVIKLSSYLLKPFADFLRVHPIRKNSFSDFIDRLLEPLMHLQDALHLGSSKWSQNLLELVNDVLAQGLFHQTHLDGYMSLQSVDKYKTFDGEKSKADVRVIKSYHRHFFDKLDKVIANKNLLPLGGIASLFRLFVSCATKHKGGSFIGEDSDANYLSSVDTERRKSLFDFFIQIMEYFLHQINIFTQAEIEVGINRLDVLGVFKSCNELLEAFKQEGIYTKLDDTSEGAGVKFLRLIYESIMSFALLEVDDLRVSSSTSSKEQQEARILLMKELVLAIHCLMDIEYEVVTDDLGRLWKLMLSFSAQGYSLVEASIQHLLNFQILHVACRLIELYKELRQVNVPIFALCEAVRLLVSPPVTESKKPISESYSSYMKSLSMFICAPELRHSICSAIKSIPEGQTSNCIQQLATDISESIDWLKVQYRLSYGDNVSRQGHDNSGFQYGLQMELTGRYLTEVYALILDSVTVTAGNSYPVSVSVNNLMAILCPSSTAKDSFFSFIFERFSCDELAESHPVPHWILFFFFRLFLSCRSLNQQVFTLVPPNISKKLSKSFNDSFTAISGNDWLEYGSQNTDDSFSCIVKGSESVLTVVETVYNVYLHNSSTLCPPLVYALCTVALQRLADLNRMLKSLEYFLARTSEPIEKNTVGTRKPSYQKENKKTMKHILNMKDEAAGLVKFIIAIVEDNQSILLPEAGYHENVSNGWDYSVGALNEKSLPYAVWLIVCQNVDLWCAHASKKAIKMFLTLLIRSSIPVVRCATKNVTLRQTSRELLRNTVLYEEKFVCRHIASTICKILVTSVSSIFPSLEDIHLNSIPNWAEIIDVLETLNNHKSQDKHAEKRNLLRTKLSSKSLSRLLGGSFRREQLVPERCIERSSSIEYLNFITWMPKGYLSSKSLLLMANCVLNIERIVVGSLLCGFKVLHSEDQFDLLRLLLSCRRTLKSLFITSVEKTNDRLFSRLYLLSEGSSMVLWLFKSLATMNKCHNLFSEDIASQTENILFSLIDHTSSTLLTISKSLTERVLVSYEKDSGTDLVSCLLVVGEKLRADIRNSLLDFELSINSGKGVLSEFQKLKEVTPVISCVQAFLWGIASGLEITSTSSHTSKKGLSKCKVEPLRKLTICVDACTEFIKYFLDFLVLRDEPSSDQVLSNTSISETGQQSMFKIGSKGNNVDSILAEDRLFDQKFSKGLFRGKNNDVTYFLRHLFLAASAGLRLKIDTPLLKNLVPVLNSIPQYISLEFPNMTSAFAYVWLDGIVKFLEELGNSLPLSNPLSSKNSFTNLIDLHLRFITACIVINEKQADQVDYKRLCLIELKNKLKSSFRVLIQKSSESHLLSTIQIIEKAICGLQEGSMDDIYSENFDSGKISATVAAGVECLDLVLEFVTGRKWMSVLKSHIRSIVSSIFSTIVSLQGPNISVENKNGGEECRVLDSTSVILTCIEVLTRVFGKHSVFQMDSSHITQSLHIPAVIFQNILQLKHTKYLDKSNPFNVSEIGNKYKFDQRYSLELYAACCRLLCTAIKHHASDAQRCVALLEDSVNVLLYCLEMVNIDQGVKCALCLRRVYEELKQQKDEFGSYCYLFLSSYIWVYNGNGLFKYGIKREIDEAMRPGVYALIDACSVEKLQHLHTVFGEGPCRITLGALIDDYKLNFQYEGKV